MRKARLLIADDDVPTQGAIRELLESEYEVVAVAPDGKTALDLAEQHQPDVVILDIRMPVLSGIAVARKLMRRAPVTRIVFVSTYAEPDYIEEAFRLGAHGYV